MKIFKIFFALYFFLCTGFTWASPPFELIWDNILKSYTKDLYRDGMLVKGIDYDQLSQSQTFESLIRQLEFIDPSVLGSKNAEKAFWINVYNIASIRLILENRKEKLNSISSLHHSYLDESPAIMIHHMPYSLQEIRHDVFPQYQDPRMYFVIDTYFASGPNLSAITFNEENVESLLSSQIKLFLEDKKKGVLIQRNTKIVYVSVIFKEVEKYLPHIFSTKDFLQQYFSESFSDYNVEYLNFNFRLNNVQD